MSSSPARPSLARRPNPAVFQAADGGDGAVVVRAQELGKTESGRRAAARSVTFAEIEAAVDVSEESDDEAADARAHESARYRSAPVSRLLRSIDGRPDAATVRRAAAAVAAVWVRDGGKTRVRKGCATTAHSFSFRCIALRSPSISALFAKLRHRPSTHHLRLIFTTCRLIVALYIALCVAFQSSNATNNDTPCWLVDSLRSARFAFARSPDSDCELLPLPRAGAALRFRGRGWFVAQMQCSAARKQRRHATQTRTLTLIATLRARLFRCRCRVVHHHITLVFLLPMTCNVPNCTHLDGRRVRSC